MDIEQLEALALSDDRTAALASLVSGSEDHDYWRAIELQHRGAYPEVDAILAAWPSRHGETARYQRVALRQRLLLASVDLDRHGQALVDALGLDLDHQPELAEAAARYPSVLDPAAVEEAALVDAALRRSRGLEDLTSVALPALVRVELDPVRRRQLLERLDRTGLPGLVALIARDLDERSSRGFGSLGLHQRLTSAELEELARLRPALRADPSWLAATLRRLRPADPVDWASDLGARVAYLDILWAAVEGLPVVYAALKAFVFHHRLACDLLTERYDLTRLRLYLALPRSGASASPTVAARFATAQLLALDNALVAATDLAPVGDDELLVRAYVVGLLATDDAVELADVLDAGWLTRVRAEVRLLAGEVDPRWAALLGAGATAALRERVDLELLPCNPQRFARDVPVVLDVAVKHVDTLRIRVFRIDTAAYFHARGVDVDVTIDLDGLAAGWEEVRELQAPPMQRQRLRLELPACDRVGTYVVELIGAGKASRALVRRGELRCAARPSVGGLMVDVVDERGHACPTASLWMGGREYRAGSSGQIPLPFSTRPGWTPVLLVDGEVAIASAVELRAESYGLRAAWLLDRQALIPGADAVAIARVDLTLGGTPASLGLLEEPYVEIVTTDRRGVAAKHRQPITVDDGEDLELRFPVPPHLAQVALAIGARVRVVSEQRTVELRHDAAIAVGAMHSTHATAAFHLIAGADGYRLALLGKSGEPRAGRSVSLELTSRVVQSTIGATLATDAEGQVFLGPLVGITALTASTGDLEQQFALGALAPVVVPRVVVRAGATVVVPIDTRLGEGPLTRERATLVELRGGAPARDLAASVTVETGRLIARDLPAGSFELRVDDKLTAITVVPVETPDAHGWASLPSGLVELSGNRTTSAVALTADALTITVADATPLTRVHVIATMLAPTPAWDPRFVASLRAPLVRSGRLAVAAYVSGRDIGDEYRYVLDRQRAPRRAGVLLDKPSLLLNPWSLRTTATVVQQARGGGGYPAPAAPPMAYGASAPAMAGRAAPGTSTSDPSFTAYDFLVASPVVLANLAPDADGRVAVARAALGAATHVLVVCVDPSATTHHRVALVGAAPAVRDLRLAAPLPLDRHVREDRRLAGLAAGAAIAVADRATSRVELVDTVDKLYRALCALSGDATLASWDFVPRWASLSEAERLALYSRHAGHELALFIYGKDRPLFERALRPYLASKLHPTFVDHWLLDAELAPYLEPWRLARLNALELALLAQRRPERRAALERRLADAVELIVVDPGADDRLVDTFIAGGDLGGDGLAADAFGAAEVEASPDLRGGSTGAFAAAAPTRDEADVARPKRAEKAKKGGRPMDRDDAMGAREQQAPLFRSADKTQEWAEHNWWHTRVEEVGPALVGVGRLWRDLAAHTGGPFLSPHVGDATASFTASMAALAFIDLPFAAVGPAIVARGLGATLTAGTHALAAVVELATVAGPPLEQVLVGQSYFRADDRWAWDGAEQVEKYVTGELLTGVVYVCQVVVTNPTSRTQRVSALHQIPTGSIAVGGAIATATERLELQPYQSSTFEYAFYFPHPGTVDHYGAQITRTAEPPLLAAVAPRRLTVVATASEVDTESWPHLAQHGSLDEVCAFIATRNLGRIDLAQIAWRARDRAAFTRLTATIAARGAYDDAVWGYGFLHHDRQRVGEWLAARDLGDLGPVLATALVSFEPVERAQYQHLEYAPLINARAHRLGDRRAILNDGLAAQWLRFLDQAAHRPAPRSEDWLVAADYLFAMERPDEAVRALGRADLVQLAGAAALQADYLHGYAAVVAGDLAAARIRVAPHLDHPVDRWRTRFVALAALVDEAAGGLAPGIGDRDSREQTLAAAAARAPSLSVRVDGGELIVEHAAVRRATLRFYRMDLELLFSRQPFFGGDTTRFGFIEPGVTQVLELPERGPTRVGLPPELRRQSVVIELVAGPVRHATTHFAHELAVAVTASYGQLQVRHATTGVPRVAAYVKCYARQPSGTVQFFKDGYTDLCGRFDYATLSTDELDRVERFALLVVDDQAGATVVEAAPPTR